MKLGIFLIALLLFSTTSALGQTSNLVVPDSIVYPIHNANRGKIAFMKCLIPIERFEETDFLTSIELKEKMDLNIRVFLENSLTNYLHFLSPQLSENELVMHGNFQFTFYVDEQQIYVENVHHGAFGTENKNKCVVFRIPLISASNEDSWGRFLWNRFLMSGGEDAFSGGKHTLKIEIRPYLKINEVIIGQLIAEGQLEIVIPEIEIKEKEIKIQVVKPHKDWEISTETFDHRKIEELNEKIARNKFKNITSIVVVKNGKLLLEEYFNGARRNSLHDTRSVGKSFASTILGLAIQDRHIESENQLLREFYDLQSFQNYSPQKDSITLKSLLTMSSLFDGSDMIQESPGNEERMYPTENWVKFALDLPIDKSKIGAPRWDYFTAGVVVLGDILHKSVPNGLEKYADEKLFRPLGITKYRWEYTPQKVANTAGGIRLRALDYAKYGQLYKNKGIWNGQQVLNEEWLTQSLSPQCTLPAGENYGYLFWNKTYMANGKRYEVDYSSGNGGNNIFIFKDQAIVVVLTATAYNTPYAHKQVDQIMQDYILPTFAK